MRNQNRVVVLAALIGAGFASTGPAASSDAFEHGPWMFQGVGADACREGNYCIYPKVRFNEAPQDSPAQYSVWLNDRPWKHFFYFGTDDPEQNGTELFGDNNPTNRVRSVVNRTDNTLHFMEWDYGPGDPCVVVPRRSMVRDVAQAAKSVGLETNNGSYGSVAFSDRGMTCTVIPSDPLGR
ncbi:hypothetical protein [Saccharopolyspora taberi]|uniref:Secreted protein n=1 Tax=Saccharopolyspora taberi TaxID=60895 RepID=A0ABN3VHK3_9PSEU